MLKPSRKTLPEDLHALQDAGGCGASQQALHEQDQRELEKLLIVLPERLASTVLEQPDFSEACVPTLYYAALCNLRFGPFIGLQDRCRAAVARWKTCPGLASSLALRDFCAEVRLYKAKACCTP